MISLRIILLNLKQNKEKMGKIHELAQKDNPAGLLFVQVRISCEGDFPPQPPKKHQQKGVDYGQKCSG